MNTTHDMPVTEHNCVLYILYTHKLESTALSGIECDVESDCDSTNIN